MALIAAVVLVGGSATQARAVPTSGGSSTTDDDGPHMVKVLLDANPGARQVDEGTVKLANGVIAKVTPATNSSFDPACGCSVRTCSYGWICFWDQDFYLGSKLALFNCGFVNIGKVFGWSNRIRSVVDNQTPNTRSDFFDWDPAHAEWWWLGIMIAFQEDPQIADLFGTTDALTVC